MDNFDIFSWKKNQYLNEVGLGSSQSQTLANLISDAMLQVDESLSFRDFAIAVAIILKEEYGTHNFGKFMEVLHAELGMEESLNEEISNLEDLEELEEEFFSKFDVRANLTPFKLEIMTRSDISEDKFEEMIKWAKKKGYNIDKTQSDRFYDFEPGERDFYPQIRFTS